MPQKNTSKDVVSRSSSEESSLKQPAIKGKKYLFTIAIDAYQNCPRLYNCVKDAKGLINLLNEKYGFQSDHIYTLFDQEATERNIFSTFRELAKIITPTDSLIIFFSGHGEYDKIFGEGYWIPIDAKEGAQEDYIANGKIKTFLNAVNSLHTFLIVDSCFSGSLFTQFKSATLAERLASEPSRWGLTAGRNEIVADGQAGTNSPFAEMLLYQLKQATTPLGVAQLCNKIVETVIANADQTPRGEPLKIKGHRGGQFFFVPTGFEMPIINDLTIPNQGGTVTKSTIESTPKTTNSNSSTIRKGIPKWSIYLSVTLLVLLGIFLFSYSDFFSPKTNEPITSTETPDRSAAPPIQLQKASQEGKYGFKDANSGRWIVPPQYKLVTGFSGGLAAVQDFNFKWGYINEQGDLVIPLLIDQPTKFGNKKRVKVMINSQWVTINKQGKAQVGNRLMDLEEYLRNGN